MTTLDMVALDPMWKATAENDLLSSTTVEPAWLRQPNAAPGQSMPLEEPSSLALVLIGAATLLAYRGICGQVVRQAPAEVSWRGQEKKHRRAA